MEYPTAPEVPSPRYAHDCTTCQFLGYKDNFDVYICPPIPIKTIYKEPDIVELECISPLEHSIIARYGNAGEDYMSAKDAAWRQFLDRFHSCYDLGPMWGSEIGAEDILEELEKELELEEEEYENNNSAR